MRINVLLYYARHNKKHNSCPQEKKKKKVFTFMNTVTNISKAYIGYIIQLKFKNSSFKTATFFPPSPSQIRKKAIPRLLLPHARTNKLNVKPVRRPSFHLLFPLEKFLNSLQARPVCQPQLPNTSRTTQAQSATKVSMATEDPAPPSGIIYAMFHRRTSRPPARLPNRASLQSLSRLPLFTGRFVPATSKTGQEFRVPLG